MAQKYKDNSNSVVHAIVERNGVFGTPRVSCAKAPWMKINVCLLVWVHCGLGCDYMVRPRWPTITILEVNPTFNLNRTTLFSQLVTISLGICIFG